ncbi:MAG: ABC transporter permease, partial [Lachnospiraceae bacterium]|nr:ABC transporter permease [Lachnospiraceae bacterium]
LLVSVLCSVGVTWLSCRRELNLVSAKLMRPKAPAAGKRVFLEYVPFIWKRLSFLRKVSVRNIFRYKKRLFMMITGISGCTALLLTGFGVRDSVVHVADVQFDKIQIYDMSVTCSGSAKESLQEEINGSGKASIAEYLCVMETSMDVVAGNSRKDVNLVVFDGKNDISAFLNLCTLQGESLDPPGEGEAILTHKAAKKLGLKEGDTCLLQNADMESMTVRITGISQNFIDNYVFIGEDTYTSQMRRAPEYKTAYINIGEGEDAHRISADLMNRDGVVRVTVNQDIRERVASMMKSMDLIVAVLILCAAGLAFIVLYNLTNINITERVREIATVKVLGFYRRETASYVFRENVILTALGTMLGLVLGHFLHLFVMSQIQIDLVSFDVRVEFLSFVYSIILTFLFAWFVNCFMRIKLEKVSMTESLKSVD